MSKAKWVLLSLLVVFIAIQFIRPARNKSEDQLSPDFVKQYAVPEQVQNILHTACYDCHSNNTYYPWYANIQPAAWIMASHIKRGKQRLNFSEYGNLSRRKQASRMREIINQVKDNEMPLSSYKWLHKDARLSRDQREQLMNWLEQTADSISADN